MAVFEDDRVIDRGVSRSCLHDVMVCWTICPALSLTTRHRDALPEAADPFAPSIISQTVDMIERRPVRSSHDASPADLSSFRVYRGRPAAAYSSTGSPFCRKQKSCGSRLALSCKPLKEECERPGPGRIVHVQRQSASARDLGRMWL